MKKSYLIAALLILAALGVYGQLQQSGGGGTAVSIVSAIPAGTNLIGYEMPIAPGCGGTTPTVHDTVGVASGAGTSVSSVTGCILAAYVNNITNSSVTLRLQDKTGTPIVWIGGNNDFSIPANSNLALPGLLGISMTSGITAIAGSGAALNLHIVTRE